MSNGKKIFITLFAALFATVTGMGIVVPLLPVYAHSIGASGFYIAMIFASFSLSRAFLLPYFGMVSDKKGRKPFIVTGLFLYTIISFIFIFCDTINSLIAVRFLQGIASAMIAPVVQAYVGDITPKDKEGFVMGTFNISMFAGLSLGPLLGGVIKDKFSLDTAFVCMGVLSFVAFLLSVIFLPSVEEEEKHRDKNSERPSMLAILKDKEVIGLFVYRTSYTTCIGIIWCFLPIFAKNTINASSSQIGILITTGVLVNGLLHMPLGWVADRANKVFLMFIGSVIICISLFLFNWTNSFEFIFGATVLFGIGGGIAMPSLMALCVIKGNNINSMGFLMAILTIAHSLGMLIGAVLAGFAMDRMVLAKSFFIGSIVIMVGFFVFYFCNQNLIKKPLNK